MYAVDVRELQRGVRAANQFRIVGGGSDGRIAVKRISCNSWRRLAQRHSRAEQSIPRAIRASPQLPS